jgi:hypothetical protein
VKVRQNIKIDISSHDYTVNHYTCNNLLRVSETKVGLLTMVLLTEIALIERIDSKEYRNKKLCENIVLWDMTLCSVVSEGPAASALDVEE